MTFTPEEAAKIPFGISESILNQELGRLHEKIEELNTERRVLERQQSLLEIIIQKSDEIKWQYAKGELPKNEQRNQKL